MLTNVNMRRALILLLLSATCLFGFAQNNQIDSLINSLKTEKTDSNIYNTYLKIAEIYKDSAYDKSLDYFNKALNIVERSRERKKVADVYHNIGYIYLTKGEFPLALSNLNNAKDILEFIKDKEGVGQILNDIGLIYKTWGKYEKSIENFLQALKIFDETGNEKFIAVVSNNIGQIYYYRNDFERAIPFFSKYLEFNKKIKNPRAVAGAANNIASAYLEQGKLDDALNYYVKSMRIYDSLGIKVGVAIIKDNIGSLYIRKEQYNDALLYNTEAAKIFEELGSQSRLCASLQCVGLAYARLNQPELALNNLNKGLEIAQKLNQKETIKDIFETQTEIFIQKKDFEKAFASYKQFTEIKDSLLNSETINKIETIQAEYESQKKEKELAEVNQKFQNQKTLGLIAVGVIVVFLFLTSLVIRENQNKRKINKISEEKLNNINKAIRKIAANHINSQIEAINSLSFFSKHWLVNSNNNHLVFIPFYKEPNIYFGLISKGFNAENEEIFILALIDFFKTSFSQNQSIKEQFSAFLTKDETWNKFNIDKQILNIDFWAYNTLTNHHIYSGNISAFHINEANQINDLSKSANVLMELKKEDRLFFCTSNNLNSFILSDQNSIQNTLNKIIEKSVDLSFDQQKEIIENSLELIEAGHGQNAQISILAIQR